MKLYNIYVLQECEMKEFFIINSKDHHINQSFLFFYRSYFSPPTASSLILPPLTNPF